jgi:general secretion pathway protein H
MALKNRSIRPALNSVARSGRARGLGFTLLELLVVISIIALATAGVSFAIRDSSETRLERDAQRLAALLDAARAQSRASGLPVRWRALPDGFRFEGLPHDSPPGQWLDSGTQPAGAGPHVLLLGPDPLIPPQRLLLVHASRPDRMLAVATDGLHPFQVEAP